MALDGVGFDVPTSWRRADTHMRGVTSAVFTPEENPRHESLTIIRTQRGIPLAHGNEADLLRLLNSAESLPGAQARPAASITTNHGMRGARVEFDYVPPGRTQSYHRVHVVVLDGDALVHVLYTAQTPDADAMALVLSTLHHEA